MVRHPLGYPVSILAPCLLLAACSSGGAASGPPAVATSTSAQQLPTATVGQPQTASLRGNSPLIASGTTPNFTTSVPANGTVFPLSDTVLQFGAANGPTGESVTDYTHILSSGTTLTFQGTQVINGVTKNVFEFKEPGLSVDVLTSGSTTLPDGRKLNLSTTTLNYALLGFWNLHTADFSGLTYWGMGFSGYQTPASAVPTSGTATYVAGGPGAATGQVSGFEFVPSGAGKANVYLSGQANVNVNFPGGTVAGSFTNMTAIIEGDMPAPTPWNDVALSGTLSGATMQGTTAVTTSPSDPGGLTMGSGTKGTFAGALFGPHGEEIGMSWNLYDPTGNGRAAFGTLGATKQ